MRLVDRRESFASNKTFKYEKIKKAGIADLNFSSYYKVLENTIELLNTGCQTFSMLYMFKF
jgi:hypothetical protein